VCLCVCKEGGKRAKARKKESSSSSETNIMVLSVYCGFSVSASEL